MQLLHKTRVVACRYKALAIGLRISPAQLGTLTTARGVTQSVVAVGAGALGDRWHRGRIVTAGEKTCRRLYVCSVGSLPC